MPPAGHWCRRAAAKEMARVLKPGGLLSFTDSVQFGDRASFDKTLGNFSNFNEPYYLTYIREDIGAHTSAPWWTLLPPGGTQVELN